MTTSYPKYFNESETLVAGLPDGYEARLRGRVEQNHVAELTQVSGRPVATLSQTDKGTWIAKLRGKSLRADTVETLARRVSIGDAKLRTSPGKIGADTLKRVLGLYEKDYVFDGSRHVGERLVGMVVKSATTGQFAAPIAADISQLYSAAYVWAEHVIGGQVEELRGRSLEGMSAADVVDLLAEMTDAGVETKLDAENWFDANGDNASHKTSMFGGRMSVFGGRTSVSDGPLF